MAVQIPVVILQVSKELTAPSELKYLMAEASIFSDKFVTFRNVRCSDNDECYCLLGCEEM